MEKFKGKAIYQPAGKASEYAKWACNFYIGCSNGCEYCYCKKGILAKVMGGDMPVLKKCFKSENHALEVFEKELIQNLSELQEHGLFFSFTTDPLLLECSDLTWKAAMFAMKNDVPVKILSKIASVCFDQIIENMHDSWKNLIAFGFTLTGHDLLEPGSSTNSERIKAMRKLHKAGFKTFASIEPIIDFESSHRMINNSSDCCDLCEIGLEGGEKYDKESLNMFIEWILEYPMGAKIYFKDSLLRQAGINREDLPENCVTRDYNIFNKVRVWKH